MKTILIVCGMRDWKDREHVFEVLDAELSEHTVAWTLEHDLHDNEPWHESPAAYHQAMLQAFVLRHGVNKDGADRFANEWALERKITVERFPAEWRVPGPGNAVDYSAGPRRNEKMAAAEPRAHKCLGFWDGKTTMRRGREVSGTLNMLQYALQYGIPIDVRPPRT